MRRSDPVWDDDGPEFEPDPFEEERKANAERAERMRRLDRMAGEDCRRLFDCLYGGRKQ